MKEKMDFLTETRYNWQLAKANMVTSFSKVPVMMKYCLEIGVVSWILTPTDFDDDIMF